MYKIKELANLAGVSVRALHHYDEIGLLVPRKNEAGYRLYDEKNLEDLQQILFFRELDFSLKRIGALLSDPGFDREKALRLQRQMLMERRARMDQLIHTIDRTLQNRKGEIEMTDKEKFKGFDFTKGNPYEAEAKQKWGTKAVEDAAGRIKGREQELGDEMNRLFFELAELRHLAPDSSEAQAAIEKYYAYLMTIHPYTPEAFEGLGQMYVADERFTRNIDQFGEGLARFLCDAMGVYAQKLKAQLKN